MLERGLRQWLSENVGDVVIGGDSNDATKSFIYDISDGVVFDTEVFDVGMMGVIFSKTVLRRRATSLSHLRGVLLGEGIPRPSRSSRRKTSSLPAWWRAMYSA